MAVIASLGGDATALRIMTSLLCYDVTSFDVTTLALL